MQSTTMTLTREGFVNSIAGVYRLFDTTPMIQFSYTPTTVSIDDTLWDDELEDEYLSAMEDLKHNRNLVSLDELQRKYA